MRQFVSVLVVLGTLAMLLTAFHPTPALADTTTPGAVSSLITGSGAGADSLLPIPSAPGMWWGGSWPWWAGMPLGTISALSGFTWPWFCCWQLYGGFWPWWGGWPWRPF